MLYSKVLLKSITTWQILYFSTVYAQSATTTTQPTVATTSRIQPPIAKPTNALATSLVLGFWNAYLSVISADPAATTYLYNNSDRARNNSNTIRCNAEAFDRATLVNGPSTAAVTIIYTSCGTNLANSYNVQCPLTSANTATCEQAYSIGTRNGTTIVTMNSSELDPVPCTITAGLEKLTAASESVTRTTASLTTEESAPVPQTTFPTVSQTGGTSRSSSAPSQSQTQSTSGGTELSSKFSALLVLVSGVVAAFLV